MIGVNVTTTTKKVLYTYSNFYCIYIVQVSKNILGAWITKYTMTGKKKKENKKI